jgi:branched-chain amino acid transport system ATP-binding protein
LSEGTGNPVLEVKNVYKYFGGLAALKNVSFTFNGGILGIIGPNGAGKTTLFNIISGVYKPTKGYIYFKGMNITGLPPHKIAKLGIARTYQIPRPFARETAKENVMVAAIYGRMKSVTMEEADEEAEKLLDFVGLGEKKDVKAGALNIVERKLLELARALATEPKLLLIDEIAAGLTPGEVDNLVQLIKKINSRRIEIIWIEHVMRAIMNAAERVIVLDFGELIADGTPKEVASNPRVIKAYLGEEYVA